MLYIPVWRSVLVWAICAIGILFALPNGFYSQVEQANDAQAIIDGGRTDTELEATAGLWPAWLPSGLVNLGLDLRGGAHLLAEVKVADVYATRMDSMWPEVRDTLAAQRDTLGFVTRDPGPPDELRVRVSNADQVQAALDLVRGLSRPVVSLTGGSGSDMDVTADNGVIVVKLSDAEKSATDNRTMQQSLEIIRRRIDAVGTREPSISRQGTDRILIQVPGVGSTAEVKAIIGTTAQLTFQPVISPTNDPNADPGPNNVLLPDADIEGQYYILERSPVVTGEDLVDSQPSFDQNGQPAVSFRFNPSGGQRFGTYTTENRGALFAIVLDNEVISAPRINEPITGGSGIITGSFTIEESTNLAVLLRAGALPASLTFLEERTIGPELGQDSINAGRLAAIVAMVVVVAFAVASYGLFGVFASIALAINIILIFGALSIIGGTLTLPGIAGIVLTIGMAVDANVLVFERIREELRSARSPARAIELGYERALSAIVDANVTTLISAVVLGVVGTGAVRGFAITLGIGIFTSVFTALFVTRAITSLWFNWAKPKTIVV